MVKVHDADPTRLSEAEIVANAILFLDAGHEAVVNVVGNGMIALLSKPELWEMLKAHPEHLETAVEEALRFDTPLQFFERVVREDLSYKGFSWPKGTKLCFYYASANRDERVFTNPDTFDITRHPNPHLSLGLGTSLLHRRTFGAARATSRALRPDDACTKLKAGTNTDV